jgi:hypothetical protein
MRAATALGDADCICELLRHGADIDLETSRGTALLAASAQGDIDTLLLLLEKGATIDYETASGVLAFEFFMITVALTVPGLNCLQRCRHHSTFCSNQAAEVCSSADLAVQRGRFRSRQCTQSHSTSCSSGTRCLESKHAAYSKMTLIEHNGCATCIVLNTDICPTLHCTRNLQILISTWHADIASLSLVVHKPCVCAQDVGDMQILVLCL